MDEIRALTGLRGIAALWVFFFHAEIFAKHIKSDAENILLSLGEAGFLGVDVFFVLSGFILAYNYGNAQLHSHFKAYGHFLWKRLARIYPVHLWALGLILIFQLGFHLAGFTLYSASHLSPMGLFKTLTLTHAWELPAPKTWNTVSWSISSEWAAYLAFPVLAFWVARVRSSAAVLALVVSLFAALALFVEQFVFKGTMAYGLLRIAMCFPAGMLVHRLWVLRGKEQSSVGAWLALLALVILIPAGNVLAQSVGAHVTLMVLPVFACVLVYGLASGTGGLCRALSTPAAGYAGHISYSFYMVHGLVFSVFGALHRQTELGVWLYSPWLLLGMIFVATWLLADLTYRLCEVPARRWMLARFKSVRSRGV